MPGSPRKRARREQAQFNGEKTTPQPDMTTIEKEIERLTAEMAKYKVTKDGAPGDYMRLMAQRRKFQAMLDPAKKGGAAKRKFKRAEIEQNAIEALVPRAIKVLEAQIDNDELDPADRRAAAKMILDWGKSKPATKIEQKVDGVTAIRFETVAFGQLPPPDYDVIEGEAEELGELEAGS